MRLNSPLQCGGSCRTDPVLPAPGVGRNEPNGGASALLCATPRVWQWWSLGEGTTEARVSAGRCAELWASAGAAPGVGRLGGGGGRSSPPLLPSICSTGAGMNPHGVVSSSLSGFRQGRNPTFICF